MNRARATWELIKQDRVSTPGKAAGLDLVQDGLIKAHDVVSNALQTVISPLNKNQYEVVDRQSPIAATYEGVRSTLKARWFKKGNPLNVVAKAATAVMEIPDGMISDVLHLGGGGKVIRTAA